MEQFRTFFKNKPFCSSFFLQSPSAFNDGNHLTRSKTWVGGGEVITQTLSGQLYMLQLIFFISVNFCFSSVLNSLAYITTPKNNGKIKINWNKKLTTTYTSPKFVEVTCHKHLILKINPFNFIYLYYGQSSAPQIYLVVTAHNGEI